MIKLSNDQIDILGRPNFACAKIAKHLIAAGVYENKAKKAEYEQAVFIKQSDAEARVKTEDRKMLGVIKKAAELTDSGYYWYRVKPSRQWKILHITAPQRLSYGIDSFEFSGPIPSPAE